jgi:quinol monooxygenase YgiN
MIMHARVTHYLVLPGKLEEFISLIQEASIVPARQKPGFKNSYILTHRSLGVCVVITLWENEAALLASENGSALQEQLIKVVSVLAALPNRELYEVNS